MKIMFVIPKNLFRPILITPDRIINQNVQIPSSRVFFPNRSRSVAVVTTILR